MKQTNTDKMTYRIQRENGTILNAGTGENSWFTLEDARELVDYSKDQRIIESDGMRILWEIL